jgi:hypothetical protein
MNPLRWKHVVAAAVLFGISFPGLAAESIAGQVVHALNGNPLRRVTLTATRVDGAGEPATTQVDENGQFVFRDLAPGGYLLSGERNNFDRQIHGSRLNPTTGAVLAVKDGQPVTGVVFRLFPNAALSGRVLDADGEPMPNVGIRIYRREYREGRRDWSPSMGGNTNDRGEYRLSILRAGSYLVSATDYNFGAFMPGAGKGPLPDAPDRVNATTYYPGTLEPERAEPVPIARGEDRRGVDIQLIKGTAVRIRGRIAGMDGSTPLVVNLRPRAAGGLLLMGGGGALVQPGERTFEIRGVRPGAYVLVLHSMGGTPAMSAPFPIEVGEQHVDGVELPMSEGMEITGRFLSEGGAKGAMARLEIPGSVWTGIAPVAAGENGEFTLKGVHAIPYRVRISGLPTNTYVKAVKLNGQAVNPDSVNFSAGAKLEIVLGKASAELKGVVLAADEKPSAGAAVVLIPESGRDELYRTATSDHEGAFQIKGVAPGRYKALAWEDVEPEAWRDPEVVKQVSNHAAQVVLEENGRGEVTLKVTPATKQ